MGLCTYVLVPAEARNVGFPRNDRYIQLWVSRHGFSVGSFLTCWTISLAHKYLFLFSVYVWVPTCVSMGHMCAWCPPGAEDGIGSLETRVTDVREPPCGCWEQPGPMQEQWTISLAPASFKYHTVCIKQSCVLFIISLHYSQEKQPPYLLFAINSLWSLRIEWVQITKIHSLYLKRVEILLLCWAMTAGLLVTLISSQPRYCAYSHEPINHWARRCLTGLSTAQSCGSVFSSEVLFPKCL